MCPVVGLGLGLGLGGVGVMLGCRRLGMRLVRVVVLVLVLVLVVLVLVVAGECISISLVFRITWGGLGLGEGGINGDLWSITFQSELLLLFLLLSMGSVI